jgi:arabinofuranosyltransferase
LLMSGSIFLGIFPEITSTTISISCAAILLLVFLHAFSKVRGLKSPWTWLPLLVLSLSASFTAWSTSGLETMLFTLLIFAGFLLFIRERESNTRFPVLSSVFLALATLTRPDGGVFIIVAGLFFLADIVTKKRSFRSGLIWALPYIVIVGTHFLWRYSYYGYWLPNTFYAKVPGIWVEQGFKYIGLYVVSYRLYWFIPFVFIPVIVRRNFVSSLFLGIIVADLAYILYVGGDVFEFRFMVVIFPYLYWLIVDGMGLIFSAGRFEGAFRYGVKFITLIAAAGLLWTTHYGSTHPITYKHRAGNTPLEDIKRYADSRAEQGKFIRSLVDEGILPRDLVIALAGSGAIPYYTELPTVDRRGISDVYIAHMPVVKRGRIGHEHSAPYDYLTERNVIILDLFNQLVFSSKEMVEAKDYYYDKRAIQVRAVEVKGQYLIFGTFVSDEILSEVFDGQPIFKISRLAE